MVNWQITSYLAEGDCRWLAGGCAERQPSCAVAALAAGCPGVTAAVPAAPELRALNVAVVADVMQQLLRAPGSDVTPVLPGNP